MFDTIFGLPVHPLVVHATVVIVPAAALAVGMAAVLPRFRAWAGYLPLLLCAAAVVLVPISTASGEALDHRLPQTQLLRDHTQIAEGLLPPVLLLALAAAGLYWLLLKERRIQLQAADLGDPAGPVDPARYPAPRSGPAALATVPRMATATVAAPGRAVMAGIMVLAAVGVLGTTVQVARIGHSGAKAAWSSVGSQPAPGSGQAENK